MSRPGHKVYSYVVEVLAYSTKEGSITGERKALADRFYKFKVIAKNTREAQAIAAELCKAGGEQAELLTHASVIECLGGCHSLAAG